MAKITLADGMTIEGTAEELRELAKVFGEVAEATEKEVPEFKVGDYAKITGAGDKPPYNSHKFPIGSIVKVDEVDDNGYGDRFLGKHIDGVGHEWWVLNEYAVKATVEEVADALGEDAEETAIEPAEETPQDVREGDYVVSSKSNVGITAGKPYKIDKVYSDGEFKFHDNDEDPRWRYAGDEDITTYRPIEGDPQVGDKILVVDAMHANGDYGNGDILTVTDYYFRGTVGKHVVDVDGDGPYLYREEFVIIERAGEEAPEETIEAGDLVRFTPAENRQYHGLREYPGIIVEVARVEDGGSAYLKKPEYVNSGYGTHTLPNEIELVAKKADRKDLA